MSNILRNMSVPPKSQVTFKQEQLKKYTLFSPDTLSRCLNELKIKGDVHQASKEYVVSHPDILKSIKKPTGYMLAECIEIPKCMSNKELTNNLNKYNFKACTDLELLILVFASTVGDLYIPNKDLSFESSKFSRILLFPEEEVNS